MGWGVRAEGPRNSQRYAGDRLRSFKEVAVKSEQPRRHTLRQPPKQSGEAYHLFLRTMHQANKWTPEGRCKGIELARQATEAGPAYAAPYAALAYMYGMLGYSGVLAPADAFPQSRAAALRALEID